MKKNQITFTLINTLFYEDQFTLNVLSQFLDLCVNLIEALIKNGLEKIKTNEDIEDEYTPSVIKELSKDTHYNHLLSLAESIVLLSDKDRKDEFFKKFSIKQFLALQDAYLNSIKSLVQRVDESKILPEAKSSQTLGSFIRNIEQFLRFTLTKVKQFEFEIERAEDNAEVEEAEVESECLLDISPPAPPPIPDSYRPRRGTISVLPTTPRTGPPPIPDSYQSRRGTISGSPTVFTENNSTTPTISKQNETDFALTFSS